MVAQGNQGGRFSSCVIGSISREEILSRQTGGRYDVFVSLPSNYSKGDRTYPLLVALDANHCVGTVVETAAIQAKTREAQEIIIVGVASTGDLNAHYLRRLRDYIPSSQLVIGEMRSHPVAKMLIEYSSAAGLNAEDEMGHADRFLRFLQDELLPQLTNEFRVDPGEIGIAGHSASGAFVNHVLLTRAAPFKKLILASFGTIWYGASLAEYEAAFVAAAGSRALEAFSCFGGRELTDRVLGPECRSSIAFLERLAAADPSISLTTRVFENETHGSMIAHALSSGIRELWPGRSYADGVGQRGE
jgi:predicted alpha/beta superfamily hydrolase